MTAVVASPEHHAATQPRLDLPRRGGHHLRLYVAAKGQHVFATLQHMPRQGGCKTIASADATRSKCSVHRSTEFDSILLFLEGAAFSLSASEADKVEEWLKALPA